jgi:pyruvate/2-oxoglutarate dehydrogenase complex dihydrolipoamide acyltransferase (E2) component
VNWDTDRRPEAHRPPEPRRRRNSAACMYNAPSAAASPISTPAAQDRSGASSAQSTRATTASATDPRRHVRRQPDARRLAAPSAIRPAGNGRGSSGHHLTVQLRQQFRAERGGGPVYYDTAHILNRNIFYYQRASPLGGKRSYRGATPSATVEEHPGEQYNLPSGTAGTRASPPPN